MRMRLLVVVLCVAALSLSGAARGFAPPCGSSTTTVTAAGDADFAPDAASVALAADGAPVDVDITISRAASGAAPLDVYFLIDGSYEARLYVMSGLRSGGSGPLADTMAAIEAAHPGTHFGVGGFINKPLPGIGWSDYYAYQHFQDVSASAAAVQAAVDTMPLSLRTAGTPKRSSLEAIYHTVQHGGADIGFRAGARRVVFVVTNAGFNVAGDANALLVEPSPISTFNGAPWSTIPANDLDEDLEGGCVVGGDVCKEGHTWIASPAPAHVGCDSCGFGCIERYEPGFLTFAAGACEEYPAVADVTGGGAAAAYEVWAYVFANWASAQAEWSALTAAMAPGSSAFTGPASGLPAAAAALAGSGAPALVHTCPLVTNVAVAASVDDFVYTVTLAADTGPPLTDASDGTYNFDIYGREYETVLTVATCADPGSAPAYAPPAPIPVVDGNSVGATLGDYVTADDPIDGYAVYDMTTMGYTAEAYHGTVEMTNAATGALTFTADSSVGDPARRRAVVVVTGMIAFTVEVDGVVYGPFLLNFTITIPTASPSASPSDSMSQSGSPAKTHSQSSSQSPSDRAQSLSQSASDGVTQSRSRSDVRSASHSQSTSPSATMTPTPSHSSSASMSDGATPTPGLVPPPVAECDGCAIPATLTQTICVSSDPLPPPPSAVSDRAPCPEIDVTPPGMGTTAFPIIVNESPLPDSRTLLWTGSFFEKLACMAPIVAMDVLVARTGFTDGPAAFQLCVRFEATRLLAAQLQNTTARAAYQASFVCATAVPVIPPPDMMARRGAPIETLNATGVSLVHFSGGAFQAMVAAAVPPRYIGMYVIEDNPAEIAGHAIVDISIGPCSSDADLDALIVPSIFGGGGEVGTGKKGGGGGGKLSGGAIAGIVIAAVVVACIFGGGARWAWRDASRSRQSAAAAAGFGSPSGPFYTHHAAHHAAHQEHEMRPLMYAGDLTNRGGNGGAQL